MRTASSTSRRSSVGRSVGGVVQVIADDLDTRDTSRSSRRAAARAGRRHILAVCRQLQVAGHRGERRRSRRQLRRQPPQRRQPLLSPSSRCTCRSSWFICNSAFHFCLLNRASPRRCRWPGRELRARISSSAWGQPIEHGVEPARQVADFVVALFSHPAVQVALLDLAYIAWSRPKPVGRRRDEPRRRRQQHEQRPEPGYRRDPQLIRST